MAFVAAAVPALKALATRVAQSETARTLATEAGTQIATALADKATHKVLQRIDGDGPSGRTNSAGAQDMPMAPRGNKLSKVSARPADSADLDATPRAPRA